METFLHSLSSYSRVILKNGKKGCGVKMEGNTNASKIKRMTTTIWGIEFFMRLAPAAVFPTGVNDIGHFTVKEPFWIAETQVTYALWYEVRKKAQEEGYTFRYLGLEGSNGQEGRPPTQKKNQPVTRVSFYDSIVWCNALSVFTGFEPVYRYQGKVLKDATQKGACTHAKAEDLSGFRLPTSMEWELSARYRGRDSSYGAIEYPAESGNYWTPGKYASGAKADCYQGEETRDAAWYIDNSDAHGEGRETQDVGQKPAGGNGLGLYDMSGNVWEWCFTKSGLRRVHRGGSWYYYPDGIQVGIVNSFHPNGANINGGFRLARNSTGEGDV